MNYLTRRKYLLAVGVVGTAGVAGCSSQDGDEELNDEGATPVNVESTTKEQTTTDRESSVPTNGDTTERETACETEARPGPGGLRYAPTDLIVTNFYNELRTVQVTITYAETGETIYANEFVLNPKESVYVTNISIPGAGVYELSASWEDGSLSSRRRVDSDTTANFRFDVFVSGGNDSLGVTTPLPGADRDDLRDRGRVIPETTTQDC